MGALLVLSLREFAFLPREGTPNDWPAHWVHGILLDSMNPGLALRLQSEPALEPLCYPVVA